MYDYFYGIQAEQFSFYRIPKLLFTHPAFKGMSTEAKTLGSLHCPPALTVLGMPDMYCTGNWWN